MPQEVKAYTREELLAGAAVKKEFIAINGDGAGFWVRDISPREWVSYVEKSKEPECEPVSDSLLLAKALINPDGTRMFGDNEFGLIADAFGISAQRKAVTAVLEMHGVSKKQIENAEKN